METCFGLIKCMLKDNKNFYKNMYLSVSICKYDKKAWENTRQTDGGRHYLQEGGEWSGRGGKGTFRP